MTVGVTMSNVNCLKKFIGDVSGATLVEYGIALLVVVIVGGATLGALATAVGNEISETTSAF